MAVGDLLSMRVHVNSPNHQIESAYSIRSITDSATLKSNLCNEFYTAVADTWVSKLSNAVHIENIVAADMFPGTALPFTREPVTPLPGLIDSPELPAQVAIILGLRTDSIGRAHRGRLYLGGLPIASVGNSQSPLLAWRLWASDIALKLLDLYGPAGSSPNGRLVVISRTVNGERRWPPLTTDVTSATTSSSWGTVRRRILAFA